MSSRTSFIKLVSLFLVLSAAVFAVGCGGMFKGKKAAEQGVIEYHKLYNDGKLAEIYASAHAKLHKATTEKDFLDLIRAVHKKLGKVTNTSNAGLRVRTRNLTTTVILTQTTTFEKGAGKEIFTFQMDGDVAVLLGYNINSKDLILK